MKKYFTSHYNDIRYPIDARENNGLRRAQIGAIHSIAAFFSVNDKQTAIVVMPTGTGKTAVAMMAPYVLLKEKILIITPSKMVRKQIGYSS